MRSQIDISLKTNEQNDLKNSFGPSYQLQVPCHLKQKQVQ